jgi:hypothetical protein
VLERATTIFGINQPALQSSGCHRQQVTNQKSGQSVKATSMNINTMVDIFVVTIVQNIMEELSSAATEEKVAFVIKALFSLLKRNDVSCS